MAKTQSQITFIAQFFPGAWRDLTVWGLAMYFILLTLNVLMKGFVEVLLPISLFGWLAGLNLAAYLWWFIRYESSR